MANLATQAIAKGKAQQNDHYWHGQSDPFLFGTSENALLALDAFEMAELGAAMADHLNGNFVAAIALKERDVIPLDYKDDKYWPDPYADLPDVRFKVWRWLKNKKRNPKFERYYL